MSTVPFEYLQNLMDAEILRQSAPALGIDPRDEDVEAEIRNRFQPALTGGQEADPGQLETGVPEQLPDVFSRQQG